jgi:hypothetical protein
VVVTFQRDRTTYSACIAGASLLEARKYEALPYTLFKGRELD